MSYHDALLYTWGLACTDNWGLLRRDHVKALAFPYRSSDAAVATGLDRLIARKKVCLQQHNGHDYVHWCFFEDFQDVRKRVGRPAFPFTCPNDGQIRIGGTSGKSAEVGGDSVLHNNDNDSNSNKTTTMTTQAAESPPSQLLQAVMARHPGSHAYLYEAYSALEDEYGQDFMWDCYRAALESGKTDPSARYLEGVARRCKAEGKMPLEREDLRDEPGNRPDNRPTEIEGFRVLGWSGDTPILDAPAKAV